MSKRQYFKVNQNIQIYRDGDETRHNTVVQDLSGSILYVAVPTVQGQPFLPARGEELQGRFFAGDAMYLFHTVALGIKTGDRVPLLMLQRPLRLERKQRRDYYRRGAICLIDFAPMAKSGGPAQGNLSDLFQAGLQWHGGKTVDLSGGGIRFTSSISLEKGSKMFLRIFIGSRQQDVVTAVGQVIRADRPHQGPNHVYSVRFTEIEERQRDRVINFIFNLTGKLNS